MATVRLSANVAANVLVQSQATDVGAICGGTNTGGPATLSGGASNGMSLLIIYKGTPETFPSFADRSTRASDVLITFTLQSTTSSYTITGTVGQKYRVLIGKHLAQQTASASGQASWFLLCRSGTTTLADKGGMLGTVGLVGSGADLEVPSTNIVSGEYYASAGFHVNLKFDWTL
jgi:hypothetical protein